VKYPLLNRLLTLVSWAIKQKRCVCRCRNDIRLDLYVLWWYGRL